MAVLAAVAFAVVLGRLYGLQVRRGDEFRSMSQNNFVQRKRLEHQRGEIVDRAGRMLVTNRPSVNVYVTPAFFPPAKRMVLRLATAAGLTRSDGLSVSKALSKAVAEEGPAILLARDLDEKRVEAVRAVQAELEVPLEAIPIVYQAPVDGEPQRMAAYIDPDHFPSTTLVLRRIQEVMGWTDSGAAWLIQRVRRARGLERYLDIIVRRDVSPHIEGRMAQLVQLGDLPGVTVRQATARQYVHGQTAAHLLGYINELRRRELDERRDEGYRLGDTIGRRGIERTFEEELRGADGRETVVVDSKGRMQGGMLAENLREDVGVREPPTPGNRVVLTIDLELQRAAEEAFNGRAGSVVVMEVNSGRLLAVTSTPAFDPNLVSGYFDRREKERLDAMKARRPWRFRAIQDYFAPGSTFKVVTALAALKAGVIKRNDKVRCTGAYQLGNTRFRCWKDKGHGQVDLTRSLARSCDVYYYTLGTRLGLDPIARMGKQMGFGAPTGIDIAGESGGIMPDAAWYKKRFGFYTLGAAVNVSIGQGAVSVTPLQLAVSFAALANGGKVYRPQVVRRIERYDSAAVRTIEPVIVRQIDASPQHLALVREGLRQVVNAPFGTAYRKRLKDLEVAGKTGTAQVAKLGKDREKSRTTEWKLRDHAWFGAFAPADDPKIVVVVLNEHGGGGSSAAAPIAMKVAQAWYDLQNRVAGRAQTPVTVARLDDLHLHPIQEQLTWTDH